MDGKVYIGSASLYWISVDIYGIPGIGGGEFIFNGNNGNKPVIHVSLGHSDIETVNMVLIHEALEAILDFMRCRYYHTGEVSSKSDCYHFMFNHEQFSVAVEYLNRFLIEAMPLVAKAWKKQHAKDSTP